uniref:Uncharacterized protein n=1 Tax=Aegilops tauschii subsp. strangulata TaxID=200361 RepID=A0A453DMU0_AEGTS
MVPSLQINKEVQELLKLTLSKARVKLTENTIFNRIVTDSNGSDPFNGKVCSVKLMACCFCSLTGVFLAYI